MLNTATAPANPVATICDKTCSSMFASSQDAVVDLSDLHLLSPDEQEDELADFFGVSSTLAAPKSPPSNRSSPRQAPKASSLRANSQTKALKVIEVKPRDESLSPSSPKAALRKPPAKMPPPIGSRNSTAAAKKPAEKRTKYRPLSLSPRSPATGKPDLDLSDLTGTSATQQSSVAPGIPEYRCVHCKDQHHGTFDAVSLHEKTCAANPAVQSDPFSRPWLETSPPVAECSPTFGKFGSNCAEPTSRNETYSDAGSDAAVYSNDAMESGSSDDEQQEEEDWTATGPDIQLITAAAHGDLEVPNPTEERT